jgi:hypothetical protein
MPESGCKRADMTAGLLIAYWKSMPPPVYALNQTWSLLEKFICKRPEKAGTMDTITDAVLKNCVQWISDGMRSELVTVMRTSVRIARAVTGRRK